MTNFQQAVHDVLQGLRRGEVVPYRRVAEKVGSPKGAIAVGRFLHDFPDTPHWRVVTSDGRLNAPDVADQKRRLLAEGVTIHDGKVAPWSDGRRSS